jgi:hypothetical protein
LQHQALGFSRCRLAFLPFPPLGRRLDEDTLDQVERDGRGFGRGPQGVADKHGRSVSEQVEFLVNQHFAETATRAAARHDPRVRGLSEARVQEMIDAAVAKMSTAKKRREGINERQSDAARQTELAVEI